MSVIVLDNICKTYPGQARPAVRGLSFTVHEGEVLTLVGPSGCGKTSTLRMIAGFEVPDTGEIRIGVRTVFGTGGWVPPENRGVGMVFQDYALFPHLNVAGNLAFGLKGMDRSQRKKRVGEVLELTGLAGMEDRYPHELSGGQQQRVALGRALAPRPHVMLLDEPFSNLDVHLRARMRREIRKILREAGVTALFVTHDRTEAFSLADRIAVIKEGELLQLGTPREVHQKPSDPFTAQFLGRTNLLQGVVEGDRLRMEIGEMHLPPHAEEGPVLVSIRPEICQPDPEGDFRGKILELEYGGDYQEVIVSAGDPPEELRLLLDPHRSIQRGDTLRFQIRAEHLTLFPADAN